MKYYKIKDIGKIISGSTPKTDVDKFWNGNIPWVTPKEISELEGPYLRDTERKLTEEGFRSCSTAMLPKGSILFTSRAPIGLVAIADIDVCTNQGFKSIQLNNDFYPLYIYYILRNNTRQLQNLGTGTTFLELSKARFEQFEIPIPEYADQIKIATILSKAEALISQRKESIDLLDDFLKSTFLKMFGDPFLNPKGYPISTLEQIVAKEKNSIVDGPFGSSLKETDYYDEGIPIIRINNIRDEGFYSEEFRYIMESKYQELIRSKVEFNDLLIARVGNTIGKSCIFDQRYKALLSTTGVAKATIDSSTANVNYVSNLFKLPQYKKYIWNQAEGGGQPYLNLKKIKAFKILLPPIDLQKQFSAIAEKTKTLKEQFKKSLSDLENLYGSLTQKCFKGELDLSVVQIDKSLSKVAEQAKEPAPTIQIQEALNAATSIAKHFEKVNDLSKAVNQFNIYFENWNKLNAQLKALPKLPESIIKAQENVARIQKAFSSVVPAAIPKTRGKLTWDNVSSEQIANLIKEYYSGFHFTSEMVTRFLSEEHVIMLKYYSSEELKKNPKANDADDFKTFLFAALNNENPFLRLEQVFYSAEADNVKLTLRDEDFELIKERDKNDRTGIYLRVVE